MTLYLLSPEIYVDATRSLAGPPAQLFNAYVGMRDDVGFVMTPWLQEQISQQLQSAGFDEAKAVDQAEFIASLGYEAKDPDDLGDEPLIAIAKSLELDSVYNASGRGDEAVDGVQFKPVSDLIGILIKD
ncbi:hypothetical protein HQ524_01830 [Candidatus Uhrbacteria bacterium]|nr:hypothetical protein [Candidatus Uhrbacteria bacterium]